MNKTRAVLASTLSPSWGMYSGYELCEHVAVRQGSEEYLDSEKYQYRPRDWDSFESGGPNESRSIGPYIRRLNEIRRAGKVMGAERIAVMAALNVAHELLSVRLGAGFDVGHAKRRLSAIESRLDAAIAKQEKLF
jgi:hypothetical protein